MERNFLNLRFHPRASPWVSIAFGGKFYGSRILGSPSKKCKIIVSKNDYKKYKSFVKGEAILEKQKSLEELIESGKSFKEINEIMNNFER